MAKNRLLALVLVLFAGACRDCETLGNAVPNGDIDPRVYEFGPITRGSRCTADLAVTNIGGRTDLSVQRAELEDKNGDWTLARNPTLVRIGGTESMFIDYLAEGAAGDLQSVSVKLTTDDPDNDGILRATVTAIVADEAAPAVKTACGANDALTSPCTTLDFGAVQVNGSGRLLPVTILNDGTADLSLFAAVINQGNPDFQVVGVRRGSELIATFPAQPILIPPGRSSDCGAPTGENNSVVIDVLYTPSALGADVDVLQVVTNAINGTSIDVPLSGVGSDVGLLVTPDLVNFGELSEGATQSIAVRVENVGTNSASVNFSCIDLENDGACEADCTGQSRDTALNGTLRCGVTTASGAAESEGFVLAPTDARPGGDDERTVTVTWSPVSGTTSIPATAVLALHSNILGNRVFTVPVIGGAIGIISVTSPDQCPGGGGICVRTAGDPGDTRTWTGTTTATLTNVGRATVTLGAVTKECAGTISDDYSLGDFGDAVLAPNESTELVISYANNDFSIVDPCNIVVAHDGAGGSTLIPIDVIPPP
jgi:hypothetical protein